MPGMRRKIPASVLRQHSLAMPFNLQIQRPYDPFIGFSQATIDALNILKPDKHIVTGWRKIMN